MPRFINKRRRKKNSFQKSKYIRTRFIERLTPTARAFMEAFAWTETLQPAKHSSYE